MKKLISTLIIFTMLFSFSTSLSASSIKFTDVSDTAWYAKSVKAMANKGMVYGIGNNKYNPQGNVTHAEYMALILRIFYNKDVKEVSNSTSWMDKYIAKAKELNLVSDKDKNYWQSPITREEVAHLMNKLYKISSNPKLSEVKIFKDKQQSSYQADINAVAGTIMIGDNDYFNPTSNLTRAEIAEILFRLYNYKYDKDAYSLNLVATNYKYELLKLVQLSDRKDLMKLENDLDTLYKNYYSIKGDRELSSIYNTILNQYKIILPSHEFVIKYVNNINNNTTDTNISKELLIQYKKLFKESPITKIERHNLYQTEYKIYNNANAYLVISVTYDNAKKSFTASDEIKESYLGTQKLLDIYTTAIKKPDLKIISELLMSEHYPNDSQGINSIYESSKKITNSTIELYNVQELLSSYKKYLDLNTLTYSIDSIKNDNNYGLVYEVLISGSKNSKPYQHKLNVCYSFTSHFLYDYFDSVTTVDTIIKNQKNPIVKELNTMKVPSNSNDPRKLSNGNIITSTGDKLIISDKNNKQLKAISISDGMFDLDISNDGKTLYYTTRRGLYSSDLNFNNKKLIIANNTNELLKYTTLININNANKCLIRIAGYEWLANVTIYNFDTNKIEFSWDPMYYSPSWNTKNKLLYVYEDPDYSTDENYNLIGYLDYKNNLLYKLKKPIAIKE